MKNLVYYFIFENDYMDDIINRLCSVFNVSQEENAMVYKDGLEQVYVLDAAGEGMACVLANNSDYIYAIYIFSKAIYQKEIEKMLNDLCDEIEEQYGEDRREFINNITMDADVMRDCIKTAKKFRDSNILEFLK
uniref:hypothetical protein n=1 Tax=Agathobacter sp. TaxID=2021311 RepID=UPI004057A268